MNGQFSKDMMKLLQSVHVNMPWKYLPQYLEMILHLHMNIEIGFEGEQLDRISRAEMESVALQLTEAQCRTTFHGPFWDLSPGSLDPLVRQVSGFRLQQFFDVLEIFQPVQVVCHTGYDPRHHQGHRQFWLDQSLVLWETLVKRAEKLNIPLLLENVWEHDPLFHRDLFHRLDSPYFGFCLDVGHQNSFSRTPLAQWIEALSDFLKEIHLHDNDGTRDAHLPIGQGNIDFALLFEMLRAKGKTPLMTLEPHHKEHLMVTLAGLMQVMNGHS